MKQKETRTFKEWIYFFLEVSEVLSFIKVPLLLTWGTLYILPLEEIGKNFLQGAFPLHYPHILDKFRSDPFGRFFGFFIATASYYGWLLLIKKFSKAHFPQRKKVPTYLFSYLFGILIMVFLLALSTFIVGYLTHQHFILRFEYQKKWFFANVLFISFFAFFSSASHELIFRRYVMDLLPRELGMDATIWLQGIVFGTFHFLPDFSIKKVFTTALFGLLLGYAKQYSGSLPFCIGLHAGTHVFIAFQYLFEVIHTQNTQLHQELMRIGNGGLVFQFLLLCCIVLFRLLLYLRKRRIKKKE